MTVKQFSWLMPHAFNSLNCQIALQNIRRLYLPMATILINTYRDLYIDKEVSYRKRALLKETL